jgi:LytS/YehU family sensor histidine kinase
VKQLTQPHSIAPLVLLTLVENACKHSMANELNKATVEIRLITDADRIVFDITNSKPSSLMKSPMQTPSIGICNMKKQLNMLYGSRFDMAVVDTDTLYQVTLTILTEKATS